MWLSVEAVLIQLAPVRPYICMYVGKQHRLNKHRDHGRRRDKQNA
jgi:hypothetical protein